MRVLDKLFDWFAYLDSDIDSYQLWIAAQLKQNQQLQGVKFSTFIIDGVSRRKCDGASTSAAA